MPGLTEEDIPRDEHRSFLTVNEYSAGDSVRSDADTQVPNASGNFERSVVQMPTQRPKRQIKPAKRLIEEI